MQEPAPKVVLIVMDGWGEAPASEKNAISLASTPFVDSLYKNYPHSHLLTSGENVGLPDGQMGNSEVGHLNLGAGRVVYQELALINKAIREKTIDRNQVLLDTFSYCVKEKKDLHFIGLLSDGGVHSHIDHLIHLCGMAEKSGVDRIFIHAFTDGRDTDPKSGILNLNKLESAIAGKKAKVASVIGRYYAMDRDKRWERVKIAYDLLVHGEGTLFESASAGVIASYADNVTDEFVKPISVRQTGNPVAVIKPDDAVICYNFRTDRCREITQVLTQTDLPDFKMTRLPLYYVTMTNYDKEFKNVRVVYEKDNLKNTLGEVLAQHEKTQLRIAETEKYPHVTFFLSGGREEVFNGEERIMIPSPKVATYDLQPEMSAEEVTLSLIKALESGKFDFVCLNFANPDMVGHTGVKPAIIKAVEKIDNCVARIVHAGLRMGYKFLITADHGNADKIVNDDGSPNTAHTTNPVPCFLVTGDKSGYKLKDGILADIAPSILHLMNIPVPSEMNGKNLVETNR